jgi:hypothetical protein
VSDDDGESAKEVYHKKETRIDIPTTSLPDGNWRTIDLDVLYDTGKCHLTTCPLDNVYRILEYVEG